MNRRKNGFISMSLIYSFFIVFVAISISLLAIYSNNLALVRNINDEIKTDLIQRGNEELVVFENLIVDGSFESESKTSSEKKWGTATSGNSSTSITTSQKYHGKYSLLMKKGFGIAYNKENIKMNKDHIYFIERFYQLTADIPANDNEKKYTTISFSSNGNTYFIEDGNISGNTPKTRSGWCIKEDCNPKTIESAIFKFNIETADYQFRISNPQVSDSINFEFYTDNYILIDLTKAFGTDKAETMLLENEDDSVAHKLENLIGKDYFEGRKIFSLYKAGV